jgi:hypothetical protein
LRRQTNNGQKSEQGLNGLAAFDPKFWKCSCQFIANLGTKCGATGVVEKPQSILKLQPARGPTTHLVENSAKIATKKLAAQNTPCGTETRESAHADTAQTSPTLPARQWSAQ